jgi:hypothetical protein
MTCLASDLDDGRALREEQRAEEVPQVVWTGALEPGRSRRWSEIRLRQFRYEVSRHGSPFQPGKTSELASGLPDASRHSARSAASGDSNRTVPSLSGLRHLQLSQREGTFDEDRPLPHMPPLEGKCLARTQAAVSENTHERGVSQARLRPQVSSHLLHRSGGRRVDDSRPSLRIAYVCRIAAAAE